MIENKHKKEKKGTETHLTLPGIFLLLTLIDKWSVLFFKLSRFFLSYTFLRFVVPFPIHSLVQSELSPSTYSAVSRSYKTREKEAKFTDMGWWDHGLLISPHIFPNLSPFFLSYHNSIHMDLTFRLIQLPSITTFDIYVKQKF